MKKILSLLLALCMVAVLLPCVALAAEGDAETPYITVRLDHGGTKNWNGKYTAGMEPKYAITADDGAISDGTADNWNIKLEYPDDNGATLTLKGATLKYAAEKDYLCMISGSANLTIKVESDSSITNKKCAAMHFSVTSTVTITGPGKLSLINDAGDAAGILFGAAKSLDAGKLVFKDADIEILVNGTSTTRYGIGFTNNEGVVIDNSKIHIIGGEKSMGISGLAIVERNEAGALTRVAPYWTSKGEVVPRNLVIQNGSVVTGNATVREFIAVTGDVIIKDSTVEASAKNSVFIKKPVLEGEYTAVAGAKADGSKVVEYTPSKFASHKYFKVVPGVVDLGSLGVATTAPTTEPTTAPTTEPTTEPTTAPTTEPTTKPTTPATDPVTNEGTTPATQPNNDQPNDDQSDDTKTDEQGGLSNGMLALISGAVVIAIGVGAFALLRFVIKPKWLMDLLDL